MLDDVHEKVRSGTALSDAFAAHGDLFPRVYTASLLAGERSGNLDAVLRRYVEYTKIIATVKRKTVSALVYPAILISLALVLVAIIVLKVVPAFSDFYATFGAELPLVTRIIVGVSDFLRGQFLLIIVVAASPRSSRSSAWVRRPGQQARFDRLLLGCRCSARSRGSSRRRRWRGRWRRCSAAACRWSTRSTSPRKSVGNQYMAAQLDIVSARVREGESFAAALEARQRVPGRRGEDGGSRRVDRRAAGDAEHRRRLLRRGDRDRRWSGSSRWSSRCCSSSWASSSRGCCWRSTCRCSS